MAKRLNGEGTVYRTSRGNYRAQLIVDGRRRSKTCDTAKECREWIKEQQDNLHKGIDLNRAEQSLEEYLDDWLSGVKLSKSAMTFATYEMLLRIYVKPYLGSLKLAEITPALLQASIDQLVRNDMPLSSIQQAYKTLKTALYQAVNLQILGYNPAERITVPKPRPKDFRVLDENQVQTYLIAADQIRPRNWCLLKLALGTGMRLGELLGLQWDDIDFGKQQLTIQRQVQRRSKDGEIFGPPKSNAGRRTITLASSLVEMLREQRKGLNLERKIKPKWVDHGMVFPGYYGQPQQRTTPQNHHKQVLAAAGLPDMRFHDLRHTAISVMLKRGVPVVEVARYVGHSKVSITLDTYGHYIPGWQDQAANAMEEIFDIQSIPA